MTKEDADYYLARSRQEAEAAIDAAKPEFARLHLEIAARYAVRASSQDEADASRTGDEDESGGDADNFRRSPRSGQA
jgi:hypothetical protein